MAIPKERCDNKETIGKIVSVDQIPQAQVVDKSPVELYKIFSQLEILCDILKGIGLNAVQVGQPWDMYVVRRSIGKPFEYYLYCKYRPLGEETIASFEGCLSLVNSNGTPRYFRVNRYKKIRLIGQKLVTEGKLVVADVNMVLSIEEDGVFCVAHQHEADHTLSILVSEIGEEQHIQNIWEAKET